MITKTFMVMMISFIFSLIIGFIIIPIFKNKKVDQRLSVYLEDTHRSKKDTPTMGGLIFVLSTLITMVLLFIFNKIKISNGLIIILFTFIGYFIIGFIDDYLIIKRNNNQGLKEYQKLLLQLFISIVFFLIFMQGNEPLLWIHTFHLKLNIGFIYGLFILFVLLASSNAVNLTDGLDGLAGGLSIIAFITFGILTYNTGWLDGYEDIGLFAFALVGGLFGFMFFNSYPAKIFMGDTGSLALGATLGTYAILTRHELLLIIIGIVFVIETMTCIIQRTYYKLTKKRVFLMTPIHHTFEKRGYKETDIVKMFWVIGLIASMIALGFGIWL